MRMLLIAMAGVAVAFIVVISLGFYIHQRTDAVPDLVFAVGAVMAIVAISSGIVGAAMGFSPKQLVRRIKRFGDKPIQRMPVARPSGPSAAHVAYVENPNATATCVHLEPIERAMRRTGVDVRLMGMSAYAPAVHAHCRIDQAGLRHVFAIPESIYYQEGYEPERSQWDNPRAEIICGVCLKADRARCSISVLHPAMCRENTPWFPFPPR